MSFPLRGRGLKYIDVKPVSISLESFPLRGRGLKYFINFADLVSVLSFPLRGRGLKFDLVTYNGSSYGRSPCGDVD